MQKFLALLQLLRLPTVFTAMADIFLGFLLTRNTLEPALDFGMLLLASSCLYLAGMVLNDVFDRKIDAQERPGRPIPSGRISVRTASIIGCLLLLAGIGAAEIVSHQSLMIAAGLAACVLAYDGLLKQTFLGPAAMGGCRFLNVMLGASANEYAHLVWAQPQLPVAAAMGVYIMGVTWFARQEARESSRLQLGLAALVINAGLLGLVSFLAVRGGEVRFERVLLVFLVIVLTIDRRIILALINPIPQVVQSAIRTQLLSLVMLNATVILYKTGSLPYALITAALLVPAIVLARKIPMT
jgi:4-hydroxybenzoate polyprenyltransferase